eukprot:366313-Chlamydomonas_euryale.AAC.8
MSGAELSCFSTAGKLGGLSHGRQGRRVLRFLLSMCMCIRARAQARATVEWEGPPPGLVAVN